jgi:hypothetical protein
MTVSGRDDGFLPPSLKIEKDKKYFKVPPVERMPSDKFRSED